MTDFDDSQLSIDNSGMSTGGDDVILGGDGVDDIDSGEGSNLVSSGRMDLDGDGEADLILSRSSWKTTTSITKTSSIMMTGCKQEMFT